MSYESPINAIETELKIFYEDGVLKAVRSVGFDVNKEELLRALKYDRDQYEKGYRDGCPAQGEWIEDGYNDEPCVCSNCGHPEPIKAMFLYSYCPNCGADMRKRK